MKKILSSFIALLIVLAGCAPYASGLWQATAHAQSLTLSRTATPKPTNSTGFVLSSLALGTGNRLPADVTCDGVGSTLPLQWTKAPKGTVSYAVVMHHNAPEGTPHWYWVLYNIPATTTRLDANSLGGGTMGTNSVNGLAQYLPPCPAGPGDKEFIFTVYALKAKPKFAPNAIVDRPALLTAIKPITLGSAELRTVYARPSVVAPTATPNPSVQPTQSPTNQPDPAVPAYNIGQATSDKAQAMTISFDALAFLTGDLGADSFFPPGKVADYWGFQYLRDNDPSGMGHSGEFLTSAAFNTLNILTADQRAALVALGKNQVSKINEYALRRFILMNAFRRTLNNELPAGATGLSLEAVKATSADLYALDAEISYERAQVMGEILHNLTPAQASSLTAMKGLGMKSWPVVSEPSDLQGLDRDVKVAVMTYASDMLSWYNGSVEADTYFCPERHGTYFGSFYLKDIKAMGDPTYAIPTTLTGDLGAMMLNKLEAPHAAQITSIVDTQRPSLLSIVDTRRLISEELRKFLAGSTADKATIVALFRQYGSYDGEIIYNMAVAFSQVGQGLNATEKTSLENMRNDLLGSMSHPTGAYLYSQAISMPTIPNTDSLFK